MIQLLIGSKAIFCNSVGSLFCLVIFADVEASITSTPATEIALFLNEINHKNKTNFSMSNKDV
jgi:hypothetical protein